MTAPAPQTSPQPTQWHLDKKVPVALIVALAIHAFSSIWWAATINTRVTNIENMADKQPAVAERVTRVEVEVKNNTKLLEKVDGKLDRVLAGQND